MFLLLCQANEDEKEVQKAADNLQKVLNGIEEIFVIVGCDRGPILKLLGKSILADIVAFVLFLKMKNYVFKNFPGCFNEKFHLYLLYAIMY